MMDTVKSFLRGVMDVAMVVIPLSVVLGVIFGPAVPFIGADTIDNISALVSDLGGSGLIGIITLGILYALFSRQKLLKYIYFKDLLLLEGLFFMSDLKIKKLLKVIKTLRDPNKGCPWDKKQTMESIIPYSIEEIYEVAEQVYAKTIWN